MDESVSAACASAEMTTGWTHNIAEVTLGGLAISLSFQQQSIFGSISTGGALWHSELVLAEYCAKEEFSPSGLHPARVLELGCGVAPCAGLVCLAKGCDVLFTDLRSVLPFVEGNIRLNHAAVVAARAPLRAGAGLTEPGLTEPGLSSGPGLSRSSCDTQELVFGEALSCRVVAMQPFELVICSDCVFRTDLHEPLGQTLKLLLSGPSTESARCRCIVAFVLRDPLDMNFFHTTCPRLGLNAIAVPVGELIRDAPWYNPHKEPGLTELSFLYEITLASLFTDPG